MFCGNILQDNDVVVYHSTDTPQKWMWTLNSILFLSTLLSAVFSLFLLIDIYGSEDVKEALLLLFYIM